MNSTAVLKKETQEQQQTNQYNLQQVLEIQRSAFNQNPAPGIDERRQRIISLKKALFKNKQALLDALNSDFGGRAKNESLLAEFTPISGNISYTLKHLKRWMKPSRRHVSYQLQPSSAKVVYQPLGVVGIVVPFNYPLMLAVSPLIAALAAGNHCMIKMSEFTPQTSQLFAQIMAEAFPKEVVTVINGEADVAASFTALPFDHLLFTGSTPVGRHVMKAAAENLTPVTLELGGKSPVIVDDDFPLEEAAKRICYGKSLNAGQTCIAPDYILVKNSQKEAFITAFQKVFQAMYPSINHNQDYTAIINQRHYQRLNRLLEDARDKGANIIPCHTDVVSDGSRRMPANLITDTTDDMGVCQQEIFGPLLPVIGIDSLNEAISYINQRPRPLALYYFGSDETVQNKVISQTHSGGVCINECLLHVAVDDLPFGGVGPSGMGQYHGHEGFLTFSNAKAVLTKGRTNSTQLMYPPYKGWLQKTMLNLFSGGKN